MGEETAQLEIANIDEIIAIVIHRILRCGFLVSLLAVISKTAPRLYVELTLFVTCDALQCS